MKYVLGVLVMALLLPVAALGQSVGATTGAINGRVVDSSDSVCRVRSRSRRRRCRRPAATPGEGNYRFPGIPLEPIGSATSFQGSPTLCARGFA